MSYTVRWTIAMTVLGVLTAVVAYVVSGSWWWALAGLLLAGVVANSIASTRAATRSRRNSR